jgi:hypothetical protein
VRRSKSLQEAGGRSCRRAVPLRAIRFRRKSERGAEALRDGETSAIRNEGEVAAPPGLTRVKLG